MFTIDKDRYTADAKRRRDQKLAQLKAMRDDWRADSKGVFVAKEQLEELDLKIYEELTQSHQEAFDLLPVDTSLDPGAEWDSYRMEEEFGEAELMDEYASDPPLVDVGVEKTPRRVANFRAAYVYTVGDGERAEITDYDLAARRARSAVRAVARRHNRHALFGAPNFAGGVPGLTNDPNVNDTTLADGNWTAVTAANMQQDLQNILDAVSEQSKGVHNPTDLALSIPVFNRANSTRVDSVSGDTVLKAIRDANPGLTVHKVSAFGGAGTGGVDLAMAFEKNPDNLTYRASVIYDEAPPVRDEWVFKVGVRGRASGTFIRRPLACAYGQITVSV